MWVSHREACLNKIDTLPNWEKKQRKVGLWNEPARERGSYTWGVSKTQRDSSLNERKKQMTMSSKSSSWGNGRRRRSRRRAPVVAVVSRGNGSRQTRAKLIGLPGLLGPNLTGQHTNSRSWIGLVSGVGRGCVDQHTCCKWVEFNPSSIRTLSNELPFRWACWFLFEVELELEYFYYI